MWGPCSPSGDRTCTPYIGPAESLNGLPFPSPGDLPGPGIEPMSPVSAVLAGGFFTVGPPGKPCAFPSFPQ